MSGVEAADFGPAAKKNAVLQKELNWTFGGETQHGWYLYAPLIQRTIHTEANPNSTDFARALSAWQKQNGLPADGILNHETWMKIVSVYQSDRFSGANRSQVFTGLETVHHLIFMIRSDLPIYAKLVKKHFPHITRWLQRQKRICLPMWIFPPKNWLKIISSYRTPEYQAQLRKQSPNASRAALGINSPHFTGRALDLYVGGTPVGTADQNRAIQVNTAVYQWLVKNADRFGFKPYFYEPWHWEYNPSTVIAQAP